MSVRRICVAWAVSALAALAVHSASNAQVVTLDYAENDVRYQTAQPCRALGGEVVTLNAQEICSGIDKNDTFCIVGSADAFPCRGFYKHVIACNAYDRPALNPFFCGEKCMRGIKKPRGDKCEDVINPVNVVNQLNAAYYVTLGFSGAAHTIVISQFPKKHTLALPENMQYNGFILNTVADGYEIQITQPLQNDPFGATILATIQCEGCHPEPVTIAANFYPLEISPSIVIIPPAAAESISPQNITAVYKSGVSTVAITFSGMRMSEMSIAAGDIITIPPSDQIPEAILQVVITAYEQNLGQNLAVGQNAPPQGRNPIPLFAVIAVTRRALLAEIIKNGRIEFSRTILPEDSQEYMKMKKSFSGESACAADSSSFGAVAESFPKITFTKEFIRPSCQNSGFHYPNISIPPFCGCAGIGNPKISAVLEFRNGNMTYANINISAEAKVNMALERNVNISQSIVKPVFKDDILLYTRYIPIYGIPVPILSFFWNMEYGGISEFNIRAEASAEYAIHASAGIEYRENEWRPMEDFMHEIKYQRPQIANASGRLRLNANPAKFSVAPLGQISGKLLKKSGVTIGAYVSPVIMFTEITAQFVDIKTRSRCQQPWWDAAIGLYGETGADFRILAGNVGKSENLPLYQFRYPLLAADLDCVLHFTKNPAAVTIDIDYTGAVYTVTATVQNGSHSDVTMLYEPGKPFPEQMSISDNIVSLNMTLGMQTLTAVINAKPTSIHPDNRASVSYPLLTTIIENLRESIKIPSNVIGMTAALTLILVPDTFVCLDGFVPARMSPEDLADALLYAAFKDDVVAACEAIRMGADVNARTDGGWTPLHYAAASDSIKVAKLLIKKKADVNGVNKDGASPLFFAAEADHVHIAKLLIDNNANVNMKYHTYHTVVFYGVSSEGAITHTPLREAAFHNSIKTAKILIANGANIHGDDIPLHIAAELNSIDVAKLLIDNGADVDKAKNSNNIDVLTPLFLAVIRNNIDMAKLLIDNEANVNGAFEEGVIYTPADWAYNMEMKDLLVMNGGKCSELQRDCSIELSGQRCPSEHVVQKYVLVEC